MTNNDYVDKYKAKGYDRFYAYLLSSAVSDLIKIQEGKDGINNPATVFLDLAERFVRQYRCENETIFLDISKAFRKAGHKIYRLMRKQNLIPKNNRFLQAVK